MKLTPLFALVALLGFAGCATESTPPPPRPFVGILSADKIGNGPRDKSSYDVLVHYENVEPDKFEIKIGFGYIPGEQVKKKIGPTSVGVYAISKSEVLHNSSGDVHFTIDPSAVTNLNGVLNGKIHAILSKYPHGKEWVVTSYNVYELQPD